LVVEVVVECHLVVVDIKNIWKRKNLHINK